MSKKIPFTDAQIQELRQNPYTYSVSAQRITFTIDFKKFFVEQVKKPKMTTEKIFLAAGYDPNMFTRSARNAIRLRILREASSPEGFKSPRGLSAAGKTAQFAAKDLSRQKTDQSIKEMQKRIVHLEQQIEFLKKISHIVRQTEK